MHIVMVHIVIKPEHIKEFIQVSIENASNSIQEPGIVRFDFIQQAGDPTRFTLVEVYRNESDQVLHRETQHYQKWRDSVADMMSEPRQGIKYHNIFPNDDNWQR